MNYVDITKNNNTFSVWNTLSGANSRGLRHPCTYKNKRKKEQIPYNLI